MFPRGSMVLCFVSIVAGVALLFFAQSSQTFRYHSQPHSVQYSDSHDTEMTVYKSKALVEHSKPKLNLDTLKIDDLKGGGSAAPPLPVSLSQGEVTVPQESLHTINILNGKAYPHHPVMLQVEPITVPVEKDFINEWNGIMVPAAYDCDMYNNGKPWGNHNYFWEVPTRWLACYMHQAEVSSGVLATQTKLPLVDDEYQEQVAVYQSVLRAKKSQAYVVAELGARWGTWSSRAVGLWKQKHPALPYNLYMVEADKGNCEGIKVVMAKNDIKYELNCDYANEASFSKWLNSVDHVDLIDVDIQGGEGDLVPKVLALFESKVYRLIIGTHSPEIHQQMKVIFSKWITIWEGPYSTQQQQNCVHHKLRRNNDKAQEFNYDWAGIIREKCYHDTARGPVASWDGELILDNPAFVDRAKAFAMTDTTLKIDDLA